MQDKKLKWSTNENSEIFYKNWLVNIRKIFGPMATYMSITYVAISRCLTKEECLDTVNRSIPYCVQPWRYLLITRVCWPTQKRIFNPKPRALYEVSDTLDVCVYVGNYSCDMGKRRVNTTSSLTRTVLPNTSVFPLHTGDPFQPETHVTVDQREETFNRNSVYNIQLLWT